MGYCAYCGSETEHLMSRTTASLKEVMITPRIIEIVPTLKVGRCPSCASITASDNRIEKIDDILKVYSENPPHYWADGISNSQRKLYLKIECLLNPSLSTMTICDVGCGKGDFLKSLSRCWRKIGVEPSIVSKEFMSDESIQLFNGTLSSVKLPRGTVDVISYLDVLEHLDDPISEIKSAFSLLKEGGRIVICVGNSEGLFSRMSGKYWYYLKVFGHIAVPSKRALVAALRNNGFSDVKVTPQMHPSSRSFFKWLSYLLLANLFQKGSVPLYRDHILVIATKQTSG